MKKIFKLMLILALFAMPSLVIASTTSETGQAVGYSINGIPLQNQPQETVLTELLAIDSKDHVSNTRSGEDVTIQLGLTFDDELITPQYFVAIPVNSESSEASHYDGQAVDSKGHQIQISLPKGKYDFFAWLITNDDNDIYLLTKSDVDVDENTTFTLSTRYANYSSSNIFHTPGLEDTHFCTTAKNTNLQDRNNRTIISLSRWSMYDNFHKNFFFNEETSPFKITQLSFSTTSAGMMYTLVPINPAKEESGPASDDDGWVVKSYSFAEQPALRKWIEIYSIVTGHEYQTNNMGGGYFFDNDILTWGASLGGWYLNSTDVMFWEPKDYDGRYKIMFKLVSPYTSGNNYSIITLPQELKDGHFVQYGTNLTTNCWNGKYAEWVWVSGGYPFPDRNPFFSGIFEDVKFGNCVPLLVNTPYSGLYWGEALSSFAGMSFVGRYGEDMTVLTEYETDDSQVTMSEYHDEFEEYLTNVVAILDGDTVCRKRSEYVSRNSWLHYDGKWKVIYKNDHILVDDEIEGSINAVVEYDSSDGNRTVPSATSLQFRNIENEVTDRFVNAADGIIQFTGSTAYTYDPLTEVKAEWSVYGSDDFFEIPIQEIDDLYFAEGYGQFFRGSLECVNLPSDNNWYDLRLTVRNERGAYQTQTISPAFKIETPSSVLNIKDESSNAVPVELWSLAGTKVANMNSEGISLSVPNGIYVQKMSDGTFRKVIISF